VARPLVGPRKDQQLVVRLPNELRRRVEEAVAAVHSEDSEPQPYVVLRPARERFVIRREGERFRVVGRMNELDASVQKELAKGLAATSSCRGLAFNIALNYGGRTEIVDACRSLASDVAVGRLSPEQIDEETLGSRLFTAGLPDPDLLIRTSGEMRVSNFLLWQIAYSEIWVTPTLWPDFRKIHLFEAILAFQKRERRYGGVIDGGRAEDSGESGEAAG